VRFLDFYIKAVEEETRTSNFNIALHYWLQYLKILKTHEKRAAVLFSSFVVSALCVHAF